MTNISWRLPGFVMYHPMSESFLDKVLSNWTEIVLPDWYGGAFCLLHLEYRISTIGAVGYLLYHMFVYNFYVIDLLTSLSVLLIIFYDGTTRDHSVYVRSFCMIMAIMFNCLAFSVVYF